jgi:predicted RNase H-like HicB family nuclease
MKKATTQTYRVIIEPDGKYFHAYVPALRGCHTFGKSITEAKKRIREAMELHISVLVDKGIKVPTDHGFESFETVSMLGSRVYA